MYMYMYDIIMYISHVNLSSKNHNNYYTCLTSYTLYMYIHCRFNQELTVCSAKKPNQRLCYCIFWKVYLRKIEYCKLPQCFRIVFFFLFSSWSVEVGRDIPRVSIGACTCKMNGLETVNVYKRFLWKCTVWKEGVITWGRGVWGGREGE